MKLNNSTPHSFVYNRDGQRVAATFSGTTTAYMGHYYEYTASGNKKYYYAGSTRVAMSDNGTMRFLLGHHLGSTSITATSKGAFLPGGRFSAFTDHRQGKKTET